MRLLVLGGTHFVGRAIVETAIAFGHDVDMANRGLTGRGTPDASLIPVDRTQLGDLARAIGDRTWDAVIDTWSGQPRFATAAARFLAPRVDHYGYVSSRSVYVWPIKPGADESHPVVDGDPEDTEVENYARLKRGSELGILAAKPDALIVRPGLILGPYENVGRLPWWLQRLDRGGRVLAPGPPDRPLQYIDARDLAEWIIRCAETRVGGVFNAVSPPGHTTMSELLNAAIATTRSTAELVWLTPHQVETAGIVGWTELPIWLPPDGEFAGLHDGDVTAAMETGLTCRPISETVEDTWDWLRIEGSPEQRKDRPIHGIDPDKEAAVLTRYASEDD